MIGEDNIGRSRMLPPLPERMRPHSLDGYVGQRHLIGEGCILRNMIESGNLSSFILWGPPGVGKTTLSRIVAQSLGREFYTLSAVSSGVKDVRDVIDKARSNSIFSRGLSPILFIDEIHRFNKSQQDALLGAVAETRRYGDGDYHHQETDSDRSSHYPPPEPESAGYEERCVHTLFPELLQPCLC